MSQLTERTFTPRPKPPRIYPLQNGDHLTREEFEERFDATPGLKKAELIDGRVYLSPPVSHFGHSLPHQDVGALIGIYRAATPGTSSGDNGSVRLDKENMPQPDLSLFVLASHGGRASVDDDDYVTGPIDLVVEVAASSASVDLHEKRSVYQRGGVGEYIVWRTYDGIFDHFALRDGQYVSTATTDGLFRSIAFPGLWLDETSLLSGDLIKALETMQQGIASPEHAAFVSLLQQRAAAAK